MLNAEELLKILACPRCHGNLNLLGERGRPAGYECPACAVVYPIQDDIPIMIVEKAVPREKWKDTLEG